MKLLKRTNESGSHNSTEYYYVLDQGKLVPIHRYSTRVVNDRNNFYETIYLDENKISGKYIIEFSFSNHGYLFVTKFSLSDIGDDGIPHSTSYGKENPYEYCDKFELDAKDKRELKEYYSIFSPMKDEINNFFKGSLVFVGRQKRLEEALSGPCPIGCLAQYKGRGNCIKVVKRWIYQLWVLKLVAEALNIKLYKRPYAQQPEVLISQGSPTPAILGRSDLGYEVTIWFEFQLTEDIHVGLPLAIRRNVSVRPDIVITKGLVNEYTDASRLLSAISNRSIIIECKEDSYNMWKRGIEDQLSDYKQLYAPKRTIIASLRATPNIRIADKTFSNLSPFNGQVIREFKEYLIKEFESLP